MVRQVNSTEFQLNQANYFDTEAPFLDLTIKNGKVSSKLYDNRNNLIFKTLNMSFLDRNSPLVLICLSKVCSYDFCSN